MLTANGSATLQRLLRRVESWWRRDSASGRPGAASKPFDDRAELAARCADLEERLASSDHALRERTELLYDLQRRYSTEHFNLYESTRDLKIERLRNAGAYTSRDTILNRARELQRRIQTLKQRLRAHEQVDDLYFDHAPIFIEEG